MSRPFGYREFSKGKLMRIVWKHIPLIALALLVFAGSATYIRAQDTASCNPAKSAVPAGSLWQKMMSGGIERSYLLYIPPGYDPAKPTPLVVSIHGFISNGDEQEQFTGWDAIAKTETFIVVYPQGTGTPSRWYAGQSRYIGKETVDDVQFFRDLFHELETNLCVDAARIFVNGLSNGGGMSNRLACEMADQIAAIGGVAGAYSPVPGGCNPVRPIPVIAFHGNADRVVNYKGAPIEGFPPIQEWARDWAVRNGCNPTPENIPATGDASGVHYTNCKANADVILYTIDGGGHTWPGSQDIRMRFIGKVSQDIDASTTMWEFFKAHPLPASS